MKLSSVKAEVAHDETVVDLPMYDRAGKEYRDSKDEPTVWQIVGVESKRYRRTDDAQTRRQLHQTSRTEPEDLRANRIELAAACVVGWRGVEDDDGNPVPCTPENVQELLGAATNLLEQVEAGIRGHAKRFTKSSREP